MNPLSFMMGDAEKAEMNADIQKQRDALPPRPPCYQLCVDIDIP